MGQAIVTGATSGIGRAISEALAAEGHRVLAIGRNPVALADLNGIAGITAIAVDLTDPSELTRALKDQEADILVNNAGIVSAPGPFADCDPGSIAMAIAVNVTAQMTLTRLVLPGMVARGRGHIFFTGSVAGHAPVANMAVYAATKHALGGFAQSLRLEVQDRGLRVTELVAGRVQTDLYRDVLSEDQRRAMYETGTLQPSDVAQCVLLALNLPDHAQVARLDIVPAQASSRVPLSEGKR